MIKIPRAADLSWLGSELTWISAAEARAVFERTNRRMNSWMGILALDAQQFHAIETIFANKTASACAWLTERIGTAERLLIIFSSQDVCTMSVTSFLERWQEMFGPGRDDVLITTDCQSWVLFYHHDDKFQFGRTKCA